MNSGQKYTADFFTKLNFPFKKGKKILDIGCGNGADSKIFINTYKLQTYGMDIYQNTSINEIKNLKFSIGSTLNLPYKKEEFDYVFLHDVLHHIDEENQDINKHIKALKEIKRVVKTNGGYVIIVEANRYNPIFYPHMVLMQKHNHFSQKYFITLISKIFPSASFSFFETHVYPEAFRKLFKIYEYIMEHLTPKQFLAYNVSIIKT